MNKRFNLYIRHTQQISVLDKWLSHFPFKKAFWVRIPSTNYVPRSPHDEARIRIGMARTLSTDSSCILTLCNSVQSEYHRAENSPSTWRGELSVQTIAYITHKVCMVTYKTTQRTLCLMGGCANIIAFKDTVLSLPQQKAWLRARPNPSQGLVGDCIKPWNCQ